MKLPLTDSTRRRVARITSIAIVSLLLAIVVTISLRAVSADAFRNWGDKFGITEQSRAGKLIKRIAPHAKLAPMQKAEKAAPFATLTVNSGGDSGTGTLRDQIAAAASGDTIDFSGVTTVTLTSGELLINKNLTINGGANGVTITRSSGTFRIFTISSGTVAMSKLTITGGNPTTQAGGIQNSGNLTMTDCAITGNTSPQGGGIQNDGVLTMTNCTVSGNTSSGAGGGLAMFGTTTTLTNCTVSGNTASGGGGGFSISSGTLNLTNCTVANNTAQDGGAMNLSGSTHVLKNTIVAGNTATVTSSENIVGTVSATCSYNLIGVGGTGGLTNGVNGNQVAVASPLLNSLASNGGYTQTISLQLGSPALDKGAAATGVTTDQRGHPRPYDAVNIAAASGGNNSDIGAYEENPTCNTVTVDPTSVPNGTVGLPYSQTFTATGGTAPYTFVVTSGSLPAGLMLASDGTLSGIPSATGTSNFTIAAAYGFGCSGSRAYSITIGSCSANTTFTVNDTGDAADAAPGNGVCATSGGVCTLRAAIQEINALPACANTVNFSVTGTINLASALPDLAASFTFNGPGANQLTIRRNTGGTYRILNIPFSAAANLSGLTLANGLNDEGGAIRNAGNLTVIACAFSGNNSKGTNAGGPTGKTGGGGAIFNDATGTLTLTRSALTGNIATGGNGETFTSNGGGGGGGGLGGAIFNNGGTVTVTNTTLSGNSAVGGAGGNGATTCPTGPGGKGGGNGANATTAAGFGGGGFGGGNDGSPTVGGRFGGGGGGRANGSQAGVNGGFLGGRGNNSTSSCTSGGGGGGGAAGGAIFNYGGTFTIVNVTIANNSATGGALGNNGGSGSAGSSRAGGIYNESGTLTIKNSILAGNTAQQTGFEDSDFNSNAITTNGYNLLGSGTGNPTGGTQDQTIAPANVFTTALGALQYFGSATQVHPPLTGSPAIDKGAAHTGITVDQRNKTRPIDQSGISSAPGGNASDIGAFEMQACAGVISITPTTLTAFGTGSPNTRTLTASGGTAPYTFSLASGSLPAGVTLTSAGVLSGTATVAGSYPFSLQVYDQNDCATTQAYTLDVITCATVTAQPQSQAVCDGSSATLSVTLSDPTGFSYQWRKGGNNISGATGSTFTIASFAPADVASYDVVMTSASCQLTSSAASLTTLGLTTMTNAMPYWAGRLNGAQFEVGTVAASGTNTWPATEPPGNAFDGTFAKSLIRNATNAGYVFTPGSCDAAGRVINQMRIYTANDSVSRDPASYAIYGTTSVISGNGPFALAQFTLISSGSLALPSGRNTSSLSDTNSQLVSFANSTAYKSYMLVFPTNSGDGASTQIGEVKFYPENFQPTLSTTLASVSQGQTTTGNSIGTATAGTLQAANTLTTAVSSDGTNFSSSATLNGVTISNVAIAANGNVTASLLATCAATNASFTVRITNNQSQSVTATVNVTVAANTAPGFASTAMPSHQEGVPVSNSQIATVSDAQTTAGNLIVTVTGATTSNGVTISNIVNTGGTITADIVAACDASDASFTLQVSDGCATATTTLNVTVTANTAPTLTYPNASVNVGNGTTVTPVTGPSDNVSVSTIVVQSVAPSTSPATITVNNTTGLVTVPNNVPGGTYTVTIRATDNCGATTDSPFTLTVVAPTLGTYPATTMTLNAQATVTPDAAPTNTTSVTVKASSGFNGTLYANPATGVVKIVNANPAGAHTVTVTAFGASGSSTKTFTLTVQSGTACATPPLFSSGTSFSGGVGYYTAVGDFNNDGKQDLAITNYNTASVSILLGDGAGGFTSGATVSVSNFPLWAAVGDFNGDGNQDLAVASSSVVAIRLGDGAGNFSLTANVSTGISCYSVALGDFNGDGKLDFVTANNGVDTASVRFGDGAGGFTGSTNVSVGDGPSSVVTGDFDNDGDMDFATSNATAGTVSVRLNNGAGMFSGATEITVGSSPEYMQLGDFNEDGNLDFVASNRSSGTLSIRFGNGAGGFTGSTNTSVGTSPAQVVVADLNNDGHQDLAVKRSNLFNHLLGDGLGGFGSPVSISVAGATGGYGLTLGDFNQDGRQDLLLDNVTTGTYYLQLGGCNTAPTITAGGPLARQAGSAGTSSTIATVSDTETAAGSLTVTATTFPTGITITSITNTSGTVTATVTAACNATVGANTVVLTVTDGNGATSTANLTVNVTAATAPTPSNAGPDQLLCATAPATLAANTPSVGAGAWSVVTGPSLSTAQFSSLSNPAATFTPAGGTGAYTLRWTITGACATSTDDVVLTCNANPTTANAGPDQTLCATSATLAANAPTVGTGVWSIISGTGGTVTTPSSPTSGFTGVAGTPYTLRWTISNSPCTASTDDVVITLTANPTAANAGPDQTVCATSATLAANTPTIGTGSWSIVSGAGGSFVNAASPTITFNGTAGTTYTLRWTISNSPCTASTDDVVITLTANPTTANAGPDQSFCGTSAATLAANTPSVGAGTWTVVSGPSTLASQFSNVNLPTATFTPAGGTGTYTLRWTISNSPCAASTDDVVLTYNAVPAITLGASPSVLPGATTANLPYSAATGSPNQYSIDYDSAANTAGFVDVTNASLTGSPIVLTVPNGAASGTYNATLTVRNSATGCVSSTMPFTVTISSCPTSFTVNNTGDGADFAPGNGVCETAAGNGICTLRAAIQEANALTACSPMTITITATGTITLGSTLPGIARSNLTISGPGADQLTVSGNNAVAVLQINSAAANVTLSGLTIANGRITNSTGAGLQNFSNGAVTLNNLAFTGNQTITGGDGAALNHNGTGTLNVNGSTFSGNVSASAGGALAISDVGAVNLTNCTFQGNTALNGGGVYNVVGNLTLLNCTLSGNTATGSVGGLARAGGTVSLKNTLVAGNTAPLNPDVAGTFTSQGNNLIGNTTGGTGFGGTDVLNISALLGTLGNYGGTTSTIPLLPGSPAINAGTATGAPSSDQRNVARVGAVDIGAFESRGFTLAIAGGNNQSTVTSSAFALPLSVSVSSANSEPVNGGRVSFTPPGSGASCTLATNPATIASGAASSAATANAIIGGPYTVAASALGATSLNFSLTNANSAPSFTPAAAISRQQGSPAGAAVAVGTVSDAQTAAGSLTVTQIAGGTATGISVTSITNTNGTITAVVTAGCTATPGTVRFQVSDGNLTGIGDLQVNVTANAAPSVTYAAASVSAGGSTSNAPTSATDNGSITGYAVQSQGTYTGTISVNAAGLVSISNAVPPGSHTITIRATDNCNATTDATFTLTVTNTNPTITAQTGLTRQQGAGGSNSQIATVGDAQSGASGVTVTVNGSASATVNGVTLSNISNSGGAVTADIVAICGASNASFTLTATDGHAATATATLNVTVTGITLSALVNGLTFVPYSQTLTASGGTGSYTFSLVSGSLPPGLTMNGNMITGTPTAAGASTFTIRADDDSNTCFGERVYTINIGSTGLMYYPLARPVRLLDTRPGASPNACNQPNAPITGGSVRTQPARGTCEGLTIPANATTITGHITTVQSGGGSLTLYPSDAPQPNVTNSNYLVNEILNNAFTVGLGVNDGAFNIFVGTNTDVVIDVTGYYAPPGAGGLYFHPLPKPIRLLDTRTGLTGCQTPGAPLQTMTTRTQTGVLSCDGVTIPTGAMALVGNATTTNSTGSGYLTLWPADAAQPFASSSNFAAGINRNAPFTVGLSLNGEFNIYTARTTDLVIDVMGYYSTQANDANGQGLLFNSLGAPLRLMDTRAGQSACYQPGAPMTGGTVYTQETQLPCTNLTSAARALVGNVSALNASANGYLTFWPSNATQPTAATSNYQTGRVFNRHFTVGLGPDNAFKRYAASTTDVIIDISGFFAP